MQFGSNGRERAVACGEIWKIRNVIIELYGCSTGNVSHSLGTMRPIIFCFLTILNFYFSTLASFADEEVCGACDRLVQVTGQFAHFKTGADRTIQGAPPGGAAAFREEIYGQHFTVTVSHLPAGKYTVAIGEVENFFTQPGQCVFDVTCGDSSLATNFDIVASAGGAGKVCYITGQVEHLDDSIHG
ncbi:MAG: malectin domain-containing carbohydrate-binding protein, partial [Limisphaerales bacterium]